MAVLGRSHPRHDRCLPWLARPLAGELELVLAAHTLAELHAVLTALPVKPRISPGTAQRLAKENFLRPRPEGRVEVVALTTRQDIEVLDAAVRASLAGGILYDALLAKVAEIAEVEALVTLNPEHFRRAWPAGADRVREP